MMAEKCAYAGCSKPLGEARLPAPMIGPDAAYCSLWCRSQDEVIRDTWDDEPEDYDDDD